MMSIGLSYSDGSDVRVRPVQGVTELVDHHGRVDERGAAAHPQARGGSVEGAAEQDIDVELGPMAGPAWPPP
jgi:hypothetical protein